MAPILNLLALFSIALAVVASPHVSRNVYNHAHRGIAHAAVQVDSSVPVTLPKKRSLSKRCIPRPANSTSAAPTSTQPAVSSAPINVAPSPVLPTTSVLPPPSPSSSSADASSSPPPPPTTSSVYVPPPTSQAPPPPPPSSSAAPPPPPTTSTPPPPPPPTSAAPPPPPAQTSAASSTSGEPAFMIGTQLGQGTYYAPGLGACGITNTATDYIAAVSHLLFDVYPGYNGVNPNTNPVCGKQVTATYQGKSVTVTITDRCTACQITDLDFSPSAFNTLADPSLGRINLSWFWL